MITLQRLAEPRVFVAAVDPGGRVLVLDGPVLPHTVRRPREGLADTARRCLTSLGLPGAGPCVRVWQRTSRASSGNELVRSVDVVVRVTLGPAATTPEAVWRQLAEFSGPDGRTAWHLLLPR